MTAVQRPPASRSQRSLRPSSATVRQRLGALLLVAVILTVIAYEVWPDPSPTPPPPDDLTHVKGYGGGLKQTFLSDPEVATILAERYRLKVDIDMVGSNDIACNILLVPEDDFVWFGDSVVLERYKSCGGTVLSADNTYYSPIVIYSWVKIVDALATAGVAQLQADGSYSLDFAALVTLIESGKTWTSLGLSGYHGAISVQTSDPQRSNSGFLLAGLLANTLNGGNVVNEATVEPLLPRIQSIIQKNGYMPGTSAELWNLFIATRIPIVALYESQIIEHAVANPDQLTQINQDIRVLYPDPTVWATHPFVARTTEGQELMRALKDCDIQRLAAEKHGQRPSVSCVEFAPAVTGIRGEVTSVIGMPEPGVMDIILEAIAGVVTVSTPAPASPPITSANGSLAWIGPASLSTRRRQRPSSKLGSSRITDRLAKSRFTLKC